MIVARMYKEGLCGGDFYIYNFIIALVPDTQSYWCSKSEALDKSSCALTHCVTQAAERAGVGGEGG